jgi:hypothetical protein
MWGVMPIKSTEDFQNKRHKKILLSILFSLSLSCDDSVVVLSCFKLTGPYRAWGEGWAGSLNRCRREARTRDDNKVSRQRICVTARSCTSTIHVATRTFGIVYIDGMLCLLCVNHPSADKIQLWANDSSCSNRLDSPTFCVSSTEYLWNFP